LGKKRGGVKSGKPATAKKRTREPRRRKGRQEGRKRGVSNVLTLIYVER